MNKIMKIMLVLLVIYLLIGFYFVITGSAPITIIDWGYIFVKAFIEEWRLDPLF